MQMEEIQEKKEESKLEDMDHLMLPPSSQPKKKKLLLSMLNSTLKSEEKEEYMQVIKKFLNLFITFHEEIKGFQCEPMHMELILDSRLLYLFD